jgi:hypothetical protein
MFLIHISAYGDFFIDLATKYLLPSLNSEGNLPYLKEIGVDAKVIIFTNSEDVEQICSTDSYNKMLTYADTEFIEIDKTLTDDSYSLLNKTYNTILSRAYSLNEKTSEDVFCLFAHADAMYSKDYLKHYMTIQAEMYMHFSVWADGNKITPFLDENYDPKTASIGIDAKLLTEKGIKASHEVIDAFSINSSKVNRNSAAMLWADEKTWVLGTFIMHPFVIKVTSQTPRTLLNKDMNPDTSINIFNSDYCKNYYVLDDTDHASTLSIEFFNRPETVEYKNECNTLALARLLGKLFYKYHYEFSKHVISFGNPPKEAVEMIENRMAKCRFWFDNHVDISHVEAHLDSVMNHSVANLATLFNNAAQAIKDALMQDSEDIFEQDLKDKILFQCDQYDTLADKSSDLQELVTKIMEIFSIAGEGRLQFDSQIEKYLSALNKQDLCGNILVYGAGAIGQLTYKALCNTYPDHKIYMVDDNANKTSMENTIYNLDDAVQIISENQKITAIICSTNQKAVEKISLNLQSRLSADKTSIININSLEI